MPFSRAERVELGELMQQWVRQPTGPTAPRVAVLILKICGIAVSKYYKGLSLSDAYDLRMEMFRLMWQSLPKYYDVKRCREEANFVWLLTRCRMYAEGHWSRGYGRIGCEYTTAKKKIAELKKNYDAEMILTDSIERPEAHPRKVCTCSHYLNSDQKN